MEATLGWDPEFCLHSTNSYLNTSDYSWLIRKQANAKIIHSATQLAIDPKK